MDFPCCLDAYKSHQSVTFAGLEGCSQNYGSLLVVDYNTAPDIFRGIELGR